MSVSAFAAYEKSQILKPFSYAHQKLGPHDVRVKISHCGVCRSDIHLIDNDWGGSRYPLVPGHEIIGTVIEQGDCVSNFSIGDRVGIGWQRGACFECDECRRGEEQMCSRAQDTCVDGYGGYAEEIQIDSRFAFLIPPALSSAEAAPLMCGGITTYSPLKYFGAKGLMRVGIVGVGGLGHLAVQFAAKMGCEVVVFSSSPNKELESKKFGAREFVLTQDKSALNELKYSLDFILSTVFVDLDWENYFDMLRSDGKLCFVGAPEKPLSLPIYKLMHGRRSICGSPIGSRTDMKEMLDFAAQNRITANIEIVPLSEVNAAIAKVRDNQARYRMVLRT